MIIGIYMRAMTLEAAFSVHPCSCLSLQSSEIKWPTVGFSQQVNLSSESLLYLHHFSTDFEWYGGKL